MTTIERLAAACLLAWIGLAAGPALAGDDDDEDDLGPWTVKIPSELRGKGYTLRLDDEEIPLDGETITFKGEAYREDIELNEKGRIHTSRIGYVEKDVLDDLRPRTWRLGLFFGATTLSGDAFDKILQTGRFSETSLDAAWQPSALGAELQFASLYSDEDGAHGIRSTYQSGQTRLNAIYELAPFRRKSGYARHIHLVTRAGVFAAHHRVEITDDVVTLKDDDDSVGVHGGLDALYNVHNFWFGLRGGVSVQEIELETFDLKTRAVESTFQIGGLYAF
jgi:hypothetical protein